MNKIIGDFDNLTQSPKSPDFGAKMNYGQVMLAVVLMDSPIKL